MSSGYKTLQFRNDGTFRILQLTDPQQSCRVTPDTIRLIDALLDASKPDLVVFTGDQLKGYARTFKQNTERRVRETVRALTEPLRRRGIPFTATFGNHDQEVGLSYREQRDIYVSFPDCIMPDTGPDAGTFQLPVKSADHTRDAMSIYMIDSGAGTVGNYDPIRPERLSWLRRTHLFTNQKNGADVPGIIFQHIPIREYYNLLIQLPSPVQGAVYASGPKKGYYLLDERLCRIGGILAEAPAIPETDSGEFGIIKNLPGIFALFCGHNHRNSYSGKVEGIELGFTPSCGFGSYGSGINRGGRTFLFRESNPAAFETRVYTYLELIGKYPSRPFRNLVDSITPANMYEVKLAIAALLVGGLIAGGVARLMKKIDE